MAIQFPNFLGVPVQKPDFSGIADVVQNYYAGKMMPKDDLIKQIQAQFSQPMAEEALTGAKLGNTKSQWDIKRIQQEINKSAYEMQQKRVEALKQQQLEDQLRRIFTGSGTPAPTTNAPNAPIGMPGASMPNQNMASMPTVRSPINPGISMPNPAQPDLQNAIAQTMGNRSPSTPTLPGMQPNLNNQQAQQNTIQPDTTPTAPQQERAETVVVRGSPNLAAVDAMYENNPLSRAFLEKKGFRKKQEIKFNAKTGETTVLTKWPSGKVTVQSAGALPGGEGNGDLALTSKMVSKHQNVISSVDNVLPVLDKIIDMKDGDYSRWTETQRGAKYNALVNQGLDTLIGALALPSSDKGLESALSQLRIGHMEDGPAYRKRIKELKSDLIKRKSYSSDLVKKSAKASKSVGRDDSDDNVGTSSIQESDPIFSDGS